jgi:hypothetical protein
MFTDQQQFIHYMYRDVDKSLARPTSRCILFDGENISFDASLVNQGGPRKHSPGP